MSDAPMYDRFAEDFERHAERSAYNAHYDRPAVLDLLGDVTGLHVLDAGCGPGLYAQQLLSSGATVTGCDASPRMIDLARARLAEGVAGGRAQLRVHDLHQPLTWLADHSVDAAVLALVLHHLDDRVTPLRDLRRVLRPGAPLVVSTMHPTADWRRTGGGYFERRVIEETWGPDWTVRYWRMSLQDWCEEFSRAGFVIDRLVEPQPAPTMARDFPEEDARLRQEPGFIAFRLLSR
ncbi:MAG: class I SAM-dependent methyltransferase [Kineosporiaceae bacterium]